MNTAEQTEPRASASVPDPANTPPQAQADSLDSFRALAAQSLLANEIHSARGNLYLSLSNLEQAQALERTIPDAEPLSEPTAAAIEDVKRALTHLRFDPDPNPNLNPTLPAR